jgi:hypothetical protein
MCKSRTVHTVYGPLRREKMIISFILFGILFLAGSGGIVFGVYGIKNRRALGYILVTIGLGLAVYAGLTIYEQAVRLRTDDRIVEVKEMLSDLEDRVKQLESVRGDFIAQREAEFRSLAKQGVAAGEMESRLQTDADVRAAVERVSLLNRWIDTCSTQIASDQSAAANYRNMLFYLENLEKVDGVSLDSLPAAAAEIDLETIEEQAKIPAGEIEAMDITHLEIERVLDMYEKEQ